MGVAGTNIHPRCSHCGQRWDWTEALKCPSCGRAGRRLLNGYCDECVEGRDSSGGSAHLKGARKCVVRGCPNHTDEGRFIGDVCAPCWSFMITGRANSSWACRNVFREVSRLLGGKAGESVEKFLADAIFVAVSAVDPRVEESPDEYSVQDSDQVATRYEPAELARMLGVAETVLSAKIDDLELGLRAANCLSRAGITTVGELVQHTECGLLRTSGGFGTSSLREIREVLARRGLRLGMVSSIERGSRT